MLHFSIWKKLFVAAVCLFAVIYSIPTFIGQDTKTGNDFIDNNKVNLGLDLRGGSYLLLEVDFKTYLKEQLENIKDDLRQQFRGKKINGDRIKYSGGFRIIEDRVKFNLVNTEIADELESFIRNISSDFDVQIEGNVVSIGFSELSIANMKRNVLEQSIEIVRRRVDETGTREPDIQRQGEERILLQVPGLENPEQLKNLLGKTAKLTFHLLDYSQPFPYSGFGVLPPGTIKLKSDTGSESYAIKKKISISGNLLTRAVPGVNQNGQNVVNIRFNSLGAKKFADITKKYVNKPFAIVLDKKVITAPNINEPILDGSAQISGNFTAQSATDLAILLRSGALPAPLNIIEERTVGPSLGADSIVAGEKAVVVGVALVIIFMLLTYGMFGLVSNLALLVNILLIISCLSLFGATLTLPGIAGIVLTMGMAVDANVLIFERIKEEVSLGKTTFAAIDNGFSQAFKTIIDSNLTTLIAALLLYMFGSGPVKGFAVTLSIGILSSMFTAILLTRLVIITWLKKTRPSSIPL